jgi:hypothetical protein
VGERGQLDSALICRPAALVEEAHWIWAKDQKTAQVDLSRFLIFRPYPMGFFN